MSMGNLLRDILAYRRRWKTMVDTNHNLKTNRIVRGTNISSKTMDVDAYQSPNLYYGSFGHGRAVGIARGASIVNRKIYSVNEEYDKVND